MIAMGWVPPHRHLLSFLDEGSPPPITTTPHSSSEAHVIRDHVNIDANMVIILAVLLCSLLCALGLNSFVRCALRCTTNRHHHHHNNHREVGPLGGPYARPASRGLKRSTIRQIPTTIYRVTSGNRTTVNNNVISMSTDCIICLGEFLEGENIKVLPKCKHGFHSKCIDTWLLEHSTCPTCRQSLLDWAGNEAIVVSMGFGNNNAMDFSRSGAIVGDGGGQRN